MLYRRLLLTALALVAGCVLTDWVLGRRMIVDGAYRGWRLPPFGTLEDPAVREVVERQAEALRAGRESPGSRTWDAELGWTNRPGHHPDTEESYFVSSIGSRGRREYPPLPAPGVVRVLCYGDSFTFGTEVADDEAWPAQLEALDRRIEALNFGVGGYGTDQALLRYRRTGRGLGAHAVLVGVHLRTIARNVNRFRPFLHPESPNVVAKPRFLFKDGELELLPMPYTTRLELLEAVLEGRARRELAPYDYWAGDDPVFAGSLILRLRAADRAWRRRRTDVVWTGGTREPLNLTVELLDRFRTEALADGAEHFLVQVFPSRSDLPYVLERGAYWAGLLRALDKRGIPWMDFATELAHAGTPDELFMKVHLNPRACALVAERTKAWLDENF